MTRGGLNRSAAGLAVALVAAGLAGCATPFADKATGIDWVANPRDGTITVSAPKMYRREALINERRDEVAWINKRLDDSAAVAFTPELARETEQVQAFAAALNLSFDPASALNYKRAKQTDDLQQQINVMQLQLQLDQLKRDADLVRQKFDAQTDPVNTNVSKLGTGTVSKAASPPTAAAVDQLKDSIDKLNTSLTGRLDATGKLAQLSGITESPLDDFRDRQAYREALKSAKNAASLDESHDLNGAALIRLSFQATVLPDAAGVAAPGVVQMTVKRPSPTLQDETSLYAAWLDHINQSLNVFTAEGWRPNTELLKTAVADNFDQVEFRYALPPPPPAAAPPPAAPPAKAKAKAKATVKAAPRPPPPTCPGFVFDARLVVDPACASLVFAAPKFVGMTANEGAFSGLDTYIVLFNLNDDEPKDAVFDRDTRLLLASYAGRLQSKCGIADFSQEAPQVRSDLARLVLGLRRAEIRQAGGGALIAMQRVAEASLAKSHMAFTPGVQAARIEARTARASLIIAGFERIVFDGCKPDTLASFRASEPHVYLPDAFRALLEGPDSHVAVYEVGPREQVQQISTVARAANGLSLALSLAAAQPGSGLGASGAASYSRQAMGRAQALERIPEVVGYTSAANGAFGWVLAPRATLDPKGNKISLEQVLKPYDLTVDLSVPGWWKRFEIVTVTKWAPGPRAIADGTLSSAGATSQTIPVVMSPNASDYDVLTSRLAAGGGEGARLATIWEIRGDTSACRASTITIRGSNLWRATTVIVGGKKLDGTAVSVLPDMGGVLVDVPALNDTVVTTTGNRVPVRVLTPYGDPDDYTGYIPAPTADCKPAKDPASDGPTATAVQPAQMQAPALITFTVAGKKLDAVDKVTLNGQAGKVVAAKDGKSLQATFTAEQTAGLPVSRDVTLELFKGDDSVGTLSIEVTANKGAK